MMKVVDIYYILLTIIRPAGVLSNYDIIKLIYHRLQSDPKFKEFGYKKVLFFQLNFLIKKLHQIEINYEHIFFDSYIYEYLKNRILF
jgi:hypothetical protein